MHAKSLTRKGTATINTQHVATVSIYELCLGLSSAIITRQHEPHSLICPIASRTVVLHNLIANTFRLDTFYLASVIHCGTTHIVKEQQLASTTKKRRGKRSLYEGRGGQLA